MGKKTAALNVRMSAEMRALISFLADDYNLSESEFVRRTFLYMDEVRPDLPIKPEGKDSAPAMMTA